MQRTDPRLRHVLRCTYRTTQGNWDLFVPFVERAVALLRPGGIEALVTPAQILGSDYAAALQGLMLENSLLVCHDFSDARPFRDAEVAVAVVAVCRLEQHGPVRLLKYAGDLTVARSMTTDVRLLRGLPSGYLGAAFNFEEEASRRLLCLPHRLTHVASLSDGASTSEAYEIRQHVEDHADPDGRYVRLVNTGTIDPFRILWGVRSVRYLGFQGLYPCMTKERLGEIAPRRLAQALACKVIVAGMATDIEAAVGVEGVLCGKSAVLVLPNDGVCSYAIAALLNSPLVRDLYRRMFSMRGFGVGTMNIGPRQLEQLPIPEPRFLMASRVRGSLSDLGRSCHRDGGLHADAGEPLEPSLTEAIDREVRLAYEASSRYSRSRE
jgi:hypothetical protein